MVCQICRFEREEVTAYMNRPLRLGRLFLVASSHVSDDLAS